MSDYKDADVACPFYKKRVPMGIRCEGLTRGGSVTVLFKRQAEKDRQMETCCCSVKRWSDCPISRALMDEYRG